MVYNVSAQACAAAERHRHTAAPLSGAADAAPAGLHLHLHRLRQLQPQTHRRGHLPSSGRAQETHRLCGVSASQTHLQNLPGNHSHELMSPDGADTVQCCKGRDSISG